MKRKLALVVSYVGSNYHGLQAQKDGKYKTVEAELAAALYSIGAILPTNDLQRIDWSRSSRTDKGVHAARIVISAKLEILADWLPKFPGTPAEVHEKQTEYLQQERTVRLKDLVTALNEKLPADIRAISCMKVNKSFTARDACTWREYEYILPAEILTVPCTRPANVPTEGPDVDYYSAHDPCLQDTELAVARLNDALQQFLGTQMFHNFNNMRKKEIDEIIERKLNPIKKKERKNARAHDEDSLNNVDIQDDEPLDEVEEEMQEIDAEVARVTAQEAASAAAERAEQKRLRAEAMPWSSYNATWAPVPVPIVDKFRIRIYMMQARLMRSADGQEMIAISVRGTGFLLK
jgi:tRNA pseudouridine(38-40) synthase